MLSSLMSLPNLHSLDLAINVSKYRHQETCHIETQFFDADYSHLPLQHVSLNGAFMGNSLHSMVSKFLGQLPQLSSLDITRFYILDIDSAGMEADGDYQQYDPGTVPRLVSLHCASITDLALTVGSSLEVLSLDLGWPNPKLGVLQTVIGFTQTSRESLRVLQLLGRGQFTSSKMDMIFAIAAAFTNLRELSVDFPMRKDSQKFFVDMEHVEEILATLLNSASEGGLRKLCRLTIAGPPFTGPARKRFIAGCTKIFGESLSLEVAGEFEEGSGCVP
ncbi:hypothetical protein DL93DRAFT_2072954 [Clavulina sp. PMI_390]|nr:hypothetical protein DL93DRAFT_2072954 [Clavulina sp. PMI_390]